MNLTDLLKSRQSSSIYVPLQCQVHSCDRPVVAYCANFYVFVCAHHKAEFCDPGKHQMWPVEEGLEAVIRQTEVSIDSSLAHIERQKQELAMYTNALYYLMKSRRAAK